MDSYLLLSGGLTAFLFFVLAGMPVGFAFALVGCGGVILVKGVDAGLSLLGTAPWQWASSLDLVCVPLFILMGQLAFQSGITQGIFLAAYKWVGRLPGGLALATCAACAGFAACTGSPLASAATMATITFPEMKRHNYDRRLAVGCIGAGGTLGILIPPSIPLIIYGFMVRESISALFIAGIMPGLVLTAFFLVLVFVMCVRNPKLGPSGESFSWGERFGSLLDGGVWSMLLLFVVVIGGLYLGVFAPSEAGAAGALGAFIIALFKGHMTPKKIFMALHQSVQLTSFIFIILIGAMIFSVFVTVTGAPSKLASLAVSLPLSRYGLLLVILLMYLPMGMLLDAMAMILLTIPIVGPIISGLGFDMVWFGIILILLMQAALLTPPVGMVAFIVQGVTGVSLADVFRGSFPFIIAIFALIVLLLGFPEISLFLVNAAR